MSTSQATARKPRDAEAKRQSNIKYRERVKAERAHARAILLAHNQDTSAQEGQNRTHVYCGEGNPSNPDRFSNVSLDATDREVMAACLRILRSESTSTSDRLKAITTYSQLRSRLAASLERSEGTPGPASDTLPPLIDLACQSRFTDTDDYSGFRGFGGSDEVDNANG